jgi:hypothetical protein
MKILCDTNLKHQCGELIRLTDTSSTYCMRERGHPDEGVKGFPGGHNIVNEAPVAKVDDASK